MKSLVLVLFITACGALSPKPTASLGETVRDYNDGIQWERFETAAMHVPARQRTKFVDDADERAKDVKITEYDIVSVDQKTPKEANVHIKVSWYKTSEGRVHETHSKQTWERQGKSWMLVDEARLRGPEMPGLPEPLMKD